MNASNLADRAGRADQADRIISIRACRLSRELDSMKEILDGVAGSEMIDLIRAETSSHLQTIRGLMKDGRILPRSNLRLSQYVISGGDSRKPDLLRADIRHRMAQNVLGLFSPLFAYDERMSSMSAIFLGRGEQTPNAVGTFLHTESVQRMSLEASSTSIRRALAGRDTLEKLATLPYSVFRYIRKLALYSSLSRDMGNLLHGFAA
jgi:hypothetical protein